MVREAAKAHLTRVFHWPPQPYSTWAGGLASGVAMAGCVLAGIMAGDIAAGLAAALGCLMIGESGIKPGVSGRRWEVLAALASAAAAALAGVFAAGQGLQTEIAVILLAAAAALAGGISRPAAVASTRFILFLIIAVSVAETMDNRMALLLLMATGMAWACLVNVLSGMLGRTGRDEDDAPDGQAVTVMGRVKRVKRWQRSLAEGPGWQYSARLTVSLAAASMVLLVWPDHHFRWIALTVALLTERRSETVPVRATQRAIGTALGVILAGLLSHVATTAWMLVPVTGLLAAARALLRARDHLAYATVTTPLILLILDAGQPPGTGILIDRLIATLIGAGLVIAANVLFDRPPFRR